MDWVHPSGPVVPALVHAQGEVVRAVPFVPRGDGDQVAADGDAAGFCAPGYLLPESRRPKILVAGS